MKLREILTGIPVLHLSDDDQAEVLGLAYSSKSVRPGFLFAALKGEKRNGLEFLQEALAQGASVVLSDQPKPQDVEVNWIHVYDAREALALCSANFYSHPSDKLKVVGITGTKGKTTIAYLLEHILKEAELLPGVIGTISYRGPGFSLEASRTTPEAPDLQRMLKEMLDKGATHCLIEVSSHALDLKRVWGISFDVAIFSNLSGEHLDYHHSMDEYFEAKKKLFTLNSKHRTAVVNGDDPWGKKLIAELPLRTVTFGLEQEAIVRAEKFLFNGSGIEASIVFPGGKIGITSPLFGKHNLYNILAAVAAGLALNISPAAIKDGISKLKRVPGRLDSVENSLGLHVFIDYAHTDNALKNLLEAVRELKPKRIILVFGAGGDRDKTKRARMGKVAATLADWTFLTSDNPRSEDPLAIIADIEKGFKDSAKNNYSVIPERERAIEKALFSSEKGDYILIAGKGHETSQVIKDNVIPFNDADVVRTLLKRIETKAGNG